MLLRSSFGKEDLSPQLLRVLPAVSLLWELSQSRDPPGPWPHLSGIYKPSPLALTQDSSTCMFCRVTQSESVSPGTVACQAPLFMKCSGKMREWVASSFSRRSSQPRDWTQVSTFTVLNSIFGHISAILFSVSWLWFPSFVNFFLSLLLSLRLSTVSFLSFLFF